MWTKHEYLCTHCNTLFEITTKNQGIEPYQPDCSCHELDGTPMASGIIRINKHDVTKVTDNHLDAVFPLDYN